MNIAPRTFFFNCLSLCFLYISPAQADRLIVDHQLQVSINPHQHTLQVRDRISLDQPGQFDFALHTGLDPRSDTPGVRLTRTGKIDGEIPLESWRITLPGDETEFNLIYGGQITHPFDSRTEAPGKQQQLLAGTISSEGVFLDAGVAWYPLFPGSLQTFNLNISLPDNWRAISQGDGPRKTGGSENAFSWTERQPQPDIYLIAGQYLQYTRNTAGGIESQVFLRQPDEELAERYLDVTDQYIKQYRTMLGDYPYAKFALVENFWETGYGMPSFTLLGPTVIRLPFILHSSYPHEILHNWWGNGVYVDYSGGNWSEGLTTYLADHLIKEQKGGGIDYRRNTLQRYASFVRNDNDFPLNEFRARHNEGSQAVGYGKSMMLFHMLRRKLGDDTFIQGLRSFYSENLFETAGFEQLQGAFEKVSSEPLDDYFEQWLGRKGAPMLEISDLSTVNRDDSYRIFGEIFQTQETPAFSLDLPIVIYFDDGRPPEQRTLHMNEKSLRLSLDVPAKPVRIDFDPWFDLFRGLHPAELPPTLASLFGSQSVLFVLPSNAPDDFKKAWETMARQWASGYERAEIRFDNEIANLDEKQAIWLLGQENRFSENFLQQLSAEQLKQEGGYWFLNGNPVSFEDRSLVLTQRTSSTQVVARVSAAKLESVKGLTRKLPHYGKYSYLAFEGAAPDIRLKGQWPISDSPMKISLTNTPPVLNEVRPTPLWPATSEDLY